MANLALPGNPRYQPKDLQGIFGYDNLYRCIAEVEIATLKTLADIGVISSEEIALLTPEVEKELLDITTTEVDIVEREVTQHDIRAWVQIAQKKVDPKLRRWIHVPLTSYDVIDTARILQFIRAHEVVKNLTNTAITHFIEKVEELKDEIQIGRTHGQHALPITVGFWLATILSRIVSNIKDANNAASNLVGKISGAVGAYNAQIGLGISKVCTEEKEGKKFEERVLEKLGLKPALVSTQILPPEPLANYLFACIKLSATFGQLGRDGRSLMRTEIGELGEPFEEGQVGSSTMAHKRNPINFENLESTWLKNKNEFGKVLDIMISDHQRDLVNSAISRDFPVIVVNLVSQLSTLLRASKKNPKPFISRISVDKEACRRNFDLQGSDILAEPIYIALQMAGYEGDAHDLVNHVAMPYSKQKKVPLLWATSWALRERLGAEEADKIWSRIPEETMKILGNPRLYIGSAKSRAEYVAVKAQEYLITQE